MTELPEWTFVPAELDAVLSDKGHNALLGHRYHAHGDGWIELAMPWHERLVDDADAGDFAAGPIMALLDNAAGVAIWLKRGGYLPQVTLDLRVDRLRRTVRGRPLICRCDCSGISGSVAFARGVAYQETPGDPACLVTTSYMLL